MSLFASLMGDVDEDPFFMGGHMRQMNQMMNSFFRDPFQDMMVPMLTDVNQMRGGNPMHRGAANQLAIPGDLGSMMGGGLMPFGFPLMPGMPNISRMFPDLNAAGHNGHISSMSTVMTMTAGPDGRPQVYQASTSTRQGPGGVRETKKTVSDSRTGVKKMSIGHHIYDRAHIIEREHNVHTGQQEEQQEFINLDEDEADEFNKEWETKTKGARNAIGYGSQNPRRHRREREPQLALPSSSSPHVDDSHQPSSSRALRNARYPKSTKPSSSSVAARIAHSPTSQKRKNEDTHEDEPKNKNRYYVNQDVVDIEEVEDDEEKADSDSTPQVVSDSEDDKNCSSDKE